MIIDENSFYDVLDKIPFAKEFKISPLEIAKGRIRSKVMFEEKLTNPYGDLHGGVLYTIADTLSGMTAETMDKIVTTLDGSIQYLKAARNTDYIICESNVIKDGKNIVVVEFKIYDQKELLLNTGTFNFFVLKQEG